MIDKPSLSIEDYEIFNKLKSMRFSGMAEALEEVLADPNAELLPFREKSNVLSRMEPTLYQEVEPLYKKGYSQISVYGSG